MLRPEAGVHQQIVDVAQPRDLAVDQILALARAVQPPGQLDLARDRLNDGVGGQLVPVPDALIRVMAVAVAVAIPVPVAIAMAVAGLGERGAGDRLEKAAEPQPYFGGRRRLARVAAVEDHVFHLVAPQALGALFAHHPRDRIGHVALAAPVRADNRRHAFVEGELGPIGKRFEAVDLETFKTHVHTTRELQIAGCGSRTKSAIEMRKPKSAVRDTQRR